MNRRRPLPWYPRRTYPPPKARSRGQNALVRVRPQSRPPLAVARYLRRSTAVNEPPTITRD